MWFATTDSNRLLAPCLRKTTNSKGCFTGRRGIVAVACFTKFDLVLSISTATERRTDHEDSERGNTGKAQSVYTANLPCSTATPPRAVGFGIFRHGHKCACGFVKDDFIDVIHGGLP